MKNVLMTLFAFISLSVFAQEKDGLNLVTGDGAKIQFVTETLDYGNVAYDSNGDRYFEFKNTGTEPLIISNCKGSCGCTVPTCPKEPILPGEKGKIKVHYDTKRPGAFTKTVTITSNAVVPSITVKIKGTVGADPNAVVAPAN